MHYSVLKNELLAIFKDLSIRVFVDGTLGAGGHAAAILEAHPEIKTYIGIDQDPDALAIAKEKLAPWKGKVEFVQGNFSEMGQIVASKGITAVDGILLDLGVSSMQLDRPEKGFSFMRDGPLDMRMSPENSLTAAEIINFWSEKDLGEIFREYGEERRWRAAARAVVVAREEGSIDTTLQLVDILLPVLPFQKYRIHPLTLIFQGLRIAVNRELDVLKNVLPVGVKMLREGGIISVISFHSLEDRIVKETFRQMASDKVNTSGIGGMFLSKEPQVKPLTKKPVLPSDEEVHLNARSRSAKLRAAEKLLTNEK